MKRKKSTAKASAWRYCSQYIRRKAADGSGMVKCVTCGDFHHWKEMDAGHFISKARGSSIYFVEENIHPQCVRCNRFLEGNKHLFTLYMLDMYGREKIEELEQLARRTESWRLSDYEEIEDYYRERCGEL
jgi:hypothetical protein